MKYKGKKVSGANYDIIVIPRPNGEDIAFRAEAVLEPEKFLELCPQPKPPQIMLPGGEKKSDFSDKAYQKALTDQGNLRYNYMVLCSLKNSPDLEWETVDLNNPDTWKNWESELRESGFNNNEIALIQMSVARANSLDQEKLDEARNRFLASLPEVSKEA